TAAAAGETPPNLVEEVRLGVIRAMIATSAASVPENAFRVCVLLGQTERARGLAALVPDPEKRRNIYFSIACYLRDVGQAENALDVLLSIEVEAHTLRVEAHTVREPAGRAGVLSKVAASLAEAGSREQANRVATRALTEV